MAQDPLQALREQITGKSDEEILEGSKTMGGIEGVLDQIFNGMAENLDPDKAQDVTVGFELSEGDKNHQYALVVKDKKATVEKRDPADARVTLQLTAPDYLRLITGQLDGMQAFMSGKLKLKGDMMFAQQFQTMFRRPGG